LQATDPDDNCPLALRVMAKKLHSWFMGPRENPPVNVSVGIYYLSCIYAAIFLVISAAEFY
jgi:hypothetical protein